MTTSRAPLAASATPRWRRERLARLLPAGARTLAGEAALVAAAGLAYFLIRGAVVDRVAEARAHAGQLMDWERALGFFWEPDLQGWALSSQFLVELLNGAYFWLHMPLIVVVAVFLFRRHRPLYRRTRNAVLLSAALALVIYALWPVAPPRFFPELGFVDTMALYSEGNYQAQELGPFVNPYAALPSLHFGWALLLGLALWQVRPTGRRATAVAAVALAAFMGLQASAVILTANHYFLDVVAGALVVVVAAALAGRLRRPHRWHPG